MHPWSVRLWLGEERAHWYHWYEHHVQQGPDCLVRSLCITSIVLTRCTQSCAGTNLVDAQQTVASIVEDVPHLPQPAVQEPGAAGVLKLLEAQSIQPVTFQEWERIDAKELARGMAQGRPRDKFVDTSDMLQLLRMHAV